MYIVQFTLFASLILTIFVGGLRLGTQVYCHSDFFSKAVHLETSKLVDHKRPYQEERKSDFCQFFIEEESYGQKTQGLHREQEKRLYFRLKTRVDYEAVK